MQKKRQVDESAKQKKNQFCCDSGLSPPNFGFSFFVNNKAVTQIKQNRLYGNVSVLVIAVCRRLTEFELSLFFLQQQCRPSNVERATPSSFRIRCRFAPSAEVRIANKQTKKHKQNRQRSQKLHF